VTSYKLLEDAQLAASNSDAAYDSQQTRSAITQLFEARSGKTPYDWQLDVAEAILLRLDSTMIAGTGSGKTITAVAVNGDTWSHALSKSLDKYENQATLLVSVVPLDILILSKLVEVVENCFHGLGG